MRLTLVGLLVLPQSVAPAVITVNGTCTLVDAITAANTDSVTGNCPAGSGADEIQLTADVTLTVVDNVSYGSGRGLPVISTDVTIKGYGFTIARGGAAPPSFGIFAVSSSGTLSLVATTVSGGGDPFFGGGIIGYRGEYHDADQQHGVRATPPPTGAAAFTTLRAAKRS